MNTTVNSGERKVRETVSPAVSLAQVRFALAAGCGF